MYQRYYDSYDFDKIPTPNLITRAEDTSIVSVNNTGEIPVIASANKSNFPEADDLLLIGVLVVLLHEECNDKALILIIGFLLLSGFINI